MQIIEFKSKGFFSSAQIFITNPDGRREVPLTEIPRGEQLRQMFHKGLPPLEILEVLGLVSTVIEESTGSIRLFTKDYDCLMIASTLLAIPVKQRKIVMKIIVETLDDPSLMTLEY